MRPRARLAQGCSQRPIDKVPGFEGLDGHSHIPFFWADNLDFASRPVAGEYECRISILDAAGNGYDIVAPFDVQPACPNRRPG